MTQEMIDQERETKKKLREENINPYTFEYLVRNNMQG